MLSNIESNPKMTMIEVKNNACSYKSNNEYPFGIQAPALSRGCMGAVNKTRGTRCEAASSHDRSPMAKQSYGNVLGHALEC